MTFGMSHEPWQDRKPVTLKDCPTCRGNGVLDDGYPCPDCGDDDLLDSLDSDLDPEDF